MITTLFGRLSQPMFTFVENDLPLRVVTYAIAMALLGEFVAYVLIYRTNSFKKMKKDFDSYKPATSSTPAGSDQAKKEVQSSSSKEKESKKQQKEQKKLATFESQVGKKMAVVQVVSGVLTMATMIFSIKAVPKIFGNQPAGTLPFEPPAFLQKITQRGLDSEVLHDARDFSPFFIFMLCQSSIRLIVQRLIGWGPSRKMLLFKPDLEKAFKSD